VGAPIEIVAVNVGPDQPIVVGAPIEISFDRLLLPTSVTRQAFVVQDLFGNYLEPTPSYDPVARVVRLCVVLEADQSYTLTITSPGDAADPLGLRAIDGAELDPSATASYTFPVVAGPAYAGTDACPQGGAAGEDAGADAGVPIVPSPVDFCSDVLPIFSSKCGTAACHSGSLPAEGLQMTSAQGILATAVGRVSQESNTGSTAAVTQPQAGGQFGVDMAIIGSADPGESWLLYKLLMAVPPPCSSTPASPDACNDAGATDFDGGSSHDVSWAPLSDAERATLAGIIPGREMPFPANPSAALDDPTNIAANLTQYELELVSLWIQQGAVVPSCSP
jgi:hypothetical protein